MTTYNPTDLKKSVLAPCHGIVVQFYVDNNKLSCHMYQRSADAFLGLPFNISSYGLLLYIISKEVNMQPDKLYMSFGDTHIYYEHLDAVNEQLLRVPMNFPTLNFEKKSLLEYTFSDFKLNGYTCHPAIKAKMIA